MQVRKRFAYTLCRTLISLMLAVVLLPLLNGQKIALENYTAKTGLPQNTINDIIQDQQGYLWFATQVGVARFDGYEFQVFNTSDGLPDDFIECLLVNKEGEIWIGTQGGIGVYDGDQIRTIGVEDGLIDNWVNGMIEDLEGNIWVWTPYGISVITSDTIVSYDRDNALAGNIVLDALVDSRGRIHIATYEKQGITIFQDPYTYELLPQEEVVRDILEVRPGEIWYATQGEGIYVSSNDGDRRLGIEEGLTDGIVLCMMKDRAGRIWCGTYMDGIFVYENNRFTPVTGLSNLDPIAEEMIEDQQGRIWIRGFNDGVWLYDAGQFKHLTLKNNLLHDDVDVIFEDRFGSIWMGTISGVSKFGRGLFEIYDQDMGIPDNQIQSVFKDSRGRIWFGAHTHLVYKQGNDIVILDESKGYSGDEESDMPLCFAEDKSHRIYIGTDNGLLSYRRSVQRVDLNGEWGETSINSLISTRSEQLWCATDSGVYILDDGRIDILGNEQKLVNQKVNALLESDHIVFCATEGGISVFDDSGKHIRDYTEENGLASNICLDMARDKNGNLWVATKSRGISKISSGLSPEIVNYSTLSGLESNTCYFVELADSVSLWIGTNLGLNMLNIETGEMFFYGYDEGFYPLESNERAISKGENGELWIGTQEGLVHYNPRYDIKHENPPELILYPPLVDGENYTSEGEDNTFPYSKNNLEFHFTGIHTTIPSRNTFSWYMEGFDKSWSEPGVSRSAPYMRMPNGHYVFRVKAFNLDGVEAEEEASFAFTIRPPVWKTFWFILLEVLTGLALVFGAFKYRERQLIKEKRILEHKVKVRTREIEDQKVEIEAQRDEISDQKSYVEEQRDQIVVQNKEITDSIQYASRIQQAVLPGKRALEKTLPDHFIFFKPRDIVSGDFYWVEKKEEQIVVCAADCTGHGVPGAFMSMLGLTFLNEIVNHEGVLKSSEILNRLRKNIIRSMSHKDEADQAKDGMDLSLVVIDQQLGMLDFAGAYNPLVLVRNEELIEYKGDKMPVGKHIVEEKPFTSNKIELEHNDMIYLYSDGFPDQFGGPKGGKFKSRPFKQLLTRISTETVKGQHGILESELKSWMGQEPQVDDILIIGIRYLKKTKPKIR